MTKVNRRTFLGSMAASGLAFAFNDVDLPTIKKGNKKKGIPHNHHQICAASDIDIDYTNWLIFGDDGTVSAFTNRCELGQGLRTVMICLLSQAMNCQTSQVKVILSDTAKCPDDGATNGSSATSMVAWKFWLAAQKIKSIVIDKGSARLGLAADEVELNNGWIVSVMNPNNRVAVSELNDGEVIHLGAKDFASVASTQYVDKGYKNVLGLQIVTGSIKFTGDLKKSRMLYGGYKTPPYYINRTKAKKVKFDQALEVPGVVKAGLVNDEPVVVAESYDAVQKGLDAIKVTWRKPTRPRQMDYEKEVRENARYFATREEQGNVDHGFSQSSRVVTETYKTHCIQTCPLETDTAVAIVKKDKAKVYVATQYPYKSLRHVANFLKIPEDQIHVIGCQVGGGFGGKIDNKVGAEAAMLAKFAGRPVKLIYTREDQFAREGRAKESVIVDISTGVDSQGNLLARKIDIFQDEGYGTSHVYNIPNVQTKLYITEMPLRHATIRGTSYMQDVFAMESHTDEVAHSIGMDPFELRRNNLYKTEVEELMQAGAEMIGYGQTTNTLESSTGMALVNHGATELGAMFVNISINPDTGVIKVNKVAAALDFGTVINYHTALTGVKGAIIWGMGFALYENIEHDGWGIDTRHLHQYHVPRFSDIPPEMDIRFMQPYPVYGPRGCGEMPAPPVAPAIANAFRNATGIRLYQTPFTPEKVLSALKG